MSGTQPAQVGVGGIQQIELGGGLLPGGQYGLERGSIFSGEAKQKVAASLHRGEPVGIFLNRRRVVGREPAELRQIGIRSVQQLSPFGGGGVDLLQRGERPVGQAEYAQRISFISFQARRQCAEPAPPGRRPD